MPLTTNIRTAKPNLFPKLSNLRLDSRHLLLLGQLASLELKRLSLVLLLGLLGLSALDLLEGILTDLLVRVLVQLLQSIGLYLVIDVALELGLVSLLIVIGQGLHVLGNVSSEDVLAEGLGVELLGLHVETGESVLGVGDENASIGSTLHGAEDTGTGGGSLETNVKEGLERAASRLPLGGLGQLVFSISLLNTLEVSVHAELLEDTAGDQETSAVCSSPVGKAVLDAIGSELVGVGRAEDLVAGDLGGHDLHDDVTVGESDHEAVLGRIVLVLGLGDETLARIVIGLSNTTAGVLSLIATAGRLGPGKYNGG